MNDDRPYWVAWAQMKRVGSVLMRRLRDRFGSLEVAWNASERELLQVEGFGRLTVSEILKQRSQLDPAQFYERHLAENPQFWTLGDGDYPRLLREIPSPPPILYYRGTPSEGEMHGSTPAIAIVGTRRPTSYGVKWTRRLTRALTQRGFTIVSGMAAGVDTEAHRTCLEAQGRTVAVFGTGVDVVYPRSNQKLYEAIVETGLAVSEYPAQTPPDRKHFPQRNRIIAGLSRATLVTEAPQKSGALITAYVANDFGRDVYAVPGSLDNLNARGCLGLIQRGAQLVMDEGQLLEALGEIPAVDATIPGFAAATPTPSPAPSPPPDLPPHLAPIFEAVSPEPIPFDSIVEISGSESAIVSAGLLQLELMGLISSLPGLRYQRS